jgi:DNA repair exonuclease SbcCD ATPase subunit
LKTEKFSQAVSKQEEIRKGLEILENQKDNLRDKIERFNEISSQISSKNIVLTKINQEIYSNNQTIENLRDEIEEVSQVHPEDNISELKNENEVLQKRKTELNQLHSVYKLGSEMLKDSGIKSRIIKQYVPIMNKLINHYLSQLGFFVQFELDENFNETIKSRYLDEFSYDSFSEGEKNRIDVALLATWRKIAKMRNSVSTNLLIMDEIFDGSLDETGIECLLGLFDESFEDSNIFIITHKKESYDRFENKIIFQKKGNFSVMT